MFTLVYGASASGKSEYAEQLALKLAGRKIYLATMEPYTKEARERIARHRLMRSGRGFETVERYTDLAHLPLQEGGNILLEDLGNLVANELFRPDGGGEKAAEDGITSLFWTCRNLTVVTNEVFLGGDLWQWDTDRYLRALASLNKTLARQADLVVEVVCGIQNVLKGEVGI